MSRDSHRKCRQHATERNIWMNAIFYFHILLLLLLPYNGPDHTHTHPPTQTPPHTRTHALRGTFDSYKWPVLVLWMCCGRHGGRRGGDCNQSADINIFRVANHKLLRLAGGTAATALCPPPLPPPPPPDWGWGSAGLLVLALSDNPRCGLSGIIN